MKFRVHPIAWVMRPVGEPIFDEHATEIRIEDESGGPFVVLKQDRDSAENGKIGFDNDEWPTLRAAIDEAVAVAEAIIKDTEKTP